MRILADAEATSPDCDPSFICSLCERLLGPSYCAGVLVSEQQARHSILDQEQCEASKRQKVGGFDVGHALLPARHQTKGKSQVAGLLYEYTVGISMCFPRWSLSDATRAPGKDLPAGA